MGEGAFGNKGRARAGGTTDRGGMAGTVGGSWLTVAVAQRVVIQSAHPDQLPMNQPPGNSELLHEPWEMASALIRAELRELFCELL